MVCNVLSSIEDMNSVFGSEAPGMGVLNLYKPERSTAGQSLTAPITVNMPLLPTFLVLSLHLVGSFAFRTSPCSLDCNRTECPSACVSPVTDPCGCCVFICGAPEGDPCSHREPCEEGLSCQSSVSSLQVDTIRSFQGEAKLIDLKKITKIKHLEFEMNASKSIVIFLKH